jgi:hypothetical protein
VELTDYPQLRIYMQKVPGGIFPIDIPAETTSDSERNPMRIVIQGLVAA